MRLTQPDAGGKDGLAVLNVHMIDLPEVRPPPGEPAVPWRLLVTKLVTNLIGSIQSSGFRWSLIRGPATMPRMSLLA